MVTVTVYPKNGTAPVPTGLSCVLSDSGDNYTCSSFAVYSVIPGDRVIATVVPPSGTSANPVSATVEIVPALSGQATVPGYCDTVGELRDGFGNLLPVPPFTLNGFGQQSTTACNFGAGTPVSVFAGTTIVRVPGNGYTGFPYAVGGKLSKLFAKQ